jgi:hypothetical protein
MVLNQRRANAMNPVKPRKADDRCSISRLAECGVQYVRNAPRITKVRASKTRIALSGPQSVKILI